MNTTAEKIAKKFAKQVTSGGGEVKHFNELTPKQAEDLAILAEECAEVIQVIGKIQRHGLFSSNPFDIYNKSNAQLLNREVGHIYVATSRLILSGVMSNEAIARSSKDKFKAIRKYLHHSKK